MGSKKRLATFALGLLLLFAVGYPGGAQVIWHAVEAIIGLTGAPLAASRGVLSEHEIDEINQLPPQAQAERLLQRAINRYDGATKLIEERVDGWRGQLHYSKALESLTYTAYNSSDLRVRAASVEVSLASFGYEKTPATVEALIRQLEADPQDRPFRLWMLALLANRGVEVERVFWTLQDYLNDPEEETRKGAVNALSMLGTDETIPVLLDVFRVEPSLAVKERAACSLADAGMLTQEQRQKAVPEFLRLMDDYSLDPTARSWTFQALREITGQGIGNDPSAWRNWAASEGY